MAGPKSGGAPGEIIEVSDFDAEHLIEGGFAIPVQRKIETPEDNVEVENTSIKRTRRK